MNVNLIDDGGYASILSVKLLKSRISNLFLFHSRLLLQFFPSSSSRHRGKTSDRISENLAS